MLHLPYFWYRVTFIWWPRLVRNLIFFLDNRLAVTVHLYLFFVPLFHDISLVGRILSLIVRAVRILTGLLLLGLTLTASGLWFLAWLGLTPLIFLFWPLDIARQLTKGRTDLTPAVKNLIKNSRNEVTVFKQQLVRLNEAGRFLNRLEIAPHAFTGLTTPLTINDWLKLASQESAGTATAPEHLLLAVLKLNQWRYQLAVDTMLWLKQMRRWQKTPFIWDGDYTIRPVGGVDRGQIGIPTPNLDRYSTDLTRAAQKRQLPEMIGKTAVVNQLIKILSRKTKNNCLIIGEPGSGKTTLVKALAQEIVRGVTAKSLRFKRLISLNTGRLAAGADSSQLGGRIETIINEIKAAGNIIVFVDEVHQLATVNQDQPETSDLFRSLEPELDDGSFQFIGATTTENYKKYIQPNEAFARLLEPVELPEAPAEITLKLLGYLAWQREQASQIVITRKALARIAELAQRYFHDRVMPDKAVNLLDEAFAAAETSETKLITSMTVNRLVAEKTKVPVSGISQSEAKLLLRLEDRLHRRVIGQEAAIKAVAQAIRRARTNLTNPKKPIAGFLFAGPTGVGKTETAKALAAEFFGSDKNMIRLDMSEYQTVESVDRVLELLTDAVRHQPYTLILLDEIEKAHQKVINLFLQVLDDARLTDTGGKTADFSNTLIIATTNAKNLRRQFAPEWLNRFSAVVTFHRLTPAQIEAVIKLKLKLLQQALLKQEIRLEFAPSVAKILANEAFSDEWGGRQADRIIQNRVESTVAEKILKGEISKNQTYLFSL